MSNPRVLPLLARTARFHMSANAARKIQVTIRSCSKLHALVKKHFRADPHRHTDNCSHPITSLIASRLRAYKTTNSWDPPSPPLTLPSSSHYLPYLPVLAQARTRL